MIRDQFLDDIFPELPYTEAAEALRSSEPVLGAAVKIEVRPLTRIIMGM